MKPELRVKLAMTLAVVSTIILVVATIKIVAADDDYKLQMLVFFPWFTTAIWLAAFALRASIVGQKDRSRLLESSAAVVGGSVISFMQWTVIATGEANALHWVAGIMFGALTAGNIWLLRQLVKERKAAKLDTASTEATP